jgi:ABC-type antimicrobial peptide transport system permease subunit
VTERTREIGLRMAIGAKGRDVLFQFLTEAVALACVGGAIGIFIGSVATRLVAAHFQWQALFSLPVMAGTILLAGLAGVVSGFYPALRASQLDPIDALRFE